jgi:hypothetical protein
MLDIEDFRNLQKFNFQDFEQQSAGEQGLIT